MPAPSGSVAKTSRAVAGLQAWGRIQVEVRILALKPCADIRVFFQEEFDPSPENVPQLSFANPNPTALTLVPA